MSDGWGWSGTVGDFLSAPRDQWMRRLGDHLVSLLGLSPSESQRDAWLAEHQIITSALRDVVLATPSAAAWGIAFEYELPLEGGRRPDVVLLAGSSVLVLEFKTGQSLLAADLDQTRAYGRDLADYHQGTHGRDLSAVLVLAGAGAFASRQECGTIVTGPDGLSHYLYSLASPGTIELQQWLDSPYEPLPTLVAAAKRIFENEPLPHVRAAHSAGIPEALEYLLAACQSAEDDSARHLAFITGVPGSGKTLLGLRLVYEGSDEAGRATFLSGNGPLVQVLQFALQSRVFVKDLHKVILDYGVKGKVPREHIIVFDEAQRAWDRERVSLKKRIDASEPDLLVQAAERVEDWAILVGLVGEGQEIYAGEEAGLEQWAVAIDPPNATERWSVHCPSRVANLFGPQTHTTDLLDLTVSLRSRRAEELHHWVADLLDGRLAAAARNALPLYGDAFTMYLTRSLDEAREFATHRYRDEPDKRFGLIASSHDDKMLPRHGVPNDFQSTRRVKFGPWFEAAPDDPQSCCALREVVTEFGCQGLELDLPIIAWGLDMRWDGVGWLATPKRRRDPVHDPRQLLQNAYRVLLTRGRDGFVIFLPPVAELDLTEHALLAAGVRPLPTLVTTVGTAGMT